MGWLSTLRTASTPSFATSTVAPTPSSNSTAICWLISLSSASRILRPLSRSAWRSANGASDVLSCPALLRARAALTPTDTVNRNVLPGSGFAFEPDLATHEFHQPPANGQAESRASVFACRRRIGLAERLKQSGRLLRRHADAGILHRESQRGPVADLVLQFRSQVHLALLRELDRIVD